MAKDIGVNVVASGFLQLLLSQISTRVITFLLNLAIARHLSPEAYGLSAVQFHLITTTILLFSREGLRRGCLRFRPESEQGPDATVDTKRVLSVAWLSLPAGLLVTSLITGSVLYMSRAAVEADPAYGTAVLLHGVAALLELAAEPLYILALVNLRFQLRAAVDTLALLVKSGLTLMLVSQTKLEPALVFSYAQIASSLVILASYAAATGLQAVQSLRMPSDGGKKKGPFWGPKEREVLWMSGLFSFQSVEKQILAEGSKLVLVTVQNQYNQGVYGLVGNLGSLLVRTIFQPLEEIAFAAFSRFQVEINEAAAAATAAAAAAATAAAAAAAAGAASATKDQPSSPDAKVSQLARVLAVLVRAVCLLGLLSASFGPAYSYTLIRLVYGTKWSETEAPRVLACYSVYILLLAVNGVSEAFVHAVLDSKGLQQINMLLVAFSVAHVTASAACIYAFGAVGLVLADSINMCLRIMSSFWYIRKQFQGLPSFSLMQLLPQSSTLLACLFASAVSLASQHFLLPRSHPASTGAFLKSSAGHVGVGILCLAVVGLACLKQERQLLMDLKALSRKPGGTAKQALKQA